MQLFALDVDNRIILADQAARKRTYFCQECNQPVRVRRGMHNRAHFFHSVPQRRCIQHGKSLEHLLTQLRIKEIIGDCTLEQRFENLGRIADVCWQREKIIFEIQCSPIDLREVKARTKDYNSAGYEVVWILHDGYFGQAAARPAEEWLLQRLCYFTNIDKKGRGLIYDQFSWFHNGRRVYTGPVLPVEIHRPLRNSKSLSFFGDFSHAPVDVAAEVEAAKRLLQRKLWLIQLRHHWQQYVMRPFDAVLRVLLERHCG